MTGFIGVDWGSSRIRAYRIDGGRAVDMREGEDGLKSVPPGGFTSLLDRYLEGWPETRVLLSGMVTSRSGWVETPYCPCPATLADLAQGAVVRREGGRELHFLPGLSHGDGATLTDVMRGEEVQLLGLPDDAPRTVVLPGTHSKWARLEAGRVIAFRTFLTGELFDLVRHRSLAGALGEGDAHDDQAFEMGLREGAHGGALTAALFSARPRVLSGALAPEGVSSFLSGLLVGNEIREADHLLGQADPVVLLGAPVLQARYAAAFASLGRACAVADADAAVIGFDRLAAALPA